MKIEGEEKGEDSDRYRVKEEGVLRKECGTLNDIDQVEKGRKRSGQVTSETIQNPLGGYSSSKNHQWRPHPTLILSSGCLNY